jgi:acetyl/propionyl-CoA carboxylase alpha subunit/acetyl-CoA carboxylase carboxyltransferase component
VAIFAEDDAGALHVRRADEARALRGRGAPAYLDGEQIVRLARDSGCDALHPGYGFLSESADFARRCEEAGLVFVGPAPDALALFGDKARTRELAAGLGVPVPQGTSGATTLAQARAFLEGLGPGAAVMIKAIHGGGGRGMRLVDRPADLEDAYARAASEAQAAFGDGAVYVERVVRNARHIEVQVAGDGSGRVAHLWERECTLQRRHQKLVEIAPAPNLAPPLRAALIDAALRLAAAVALRGLATCEFLVDASGGEFAFIEGNARLQVEHTVTEEVTALDLVGLQLALAGGASLEAAGLARELPEPRGYALQLRVNAETMLPSGEAHPAAGTLSAFEIPSGPGVRVDTDASAGSQRSLLYDSLLAKLIVHATTGGVGGALAKATRALDEFRVEGVATNRAFLRRLIAHAQVRAWRATTRFVDEHAAELADSSGAPAVAAVETDGVVSVRAPMAGRVVTVGALAGDRVRRGAQLAVIEAMKMEHVVVAGTAGTVVHVGVGAEAIVTGGDVLMTIEPALDDLAEGAAASAVDLDAERADLGEVRARHAATLDAARPAAVSRRHAAGGRTARENVEDLCDPGTFLEYGALALPAQRRRRPVAELIANYPADGLVGGVGDVNGAHFAPERTRCVVMAYDYTVFAGTQGALNHKKTDRLAALAQRHRLPVIFFTEGGGGRPGDTDASFVSGLDVTTFANFARLSGLVPRVGVASGRCFAGNAALLGCCDVVIATANATIGMGGPAMIEGGGLGVFAPDAVGPLATQIPSGVVDVAVADEAEAVRVAKTYLGYFQGIREPWECADQRLLRTVVPEHRLRVYEMRRAIALLADTGSVLDLRPNFAPGMITALARVEGRPLGIIANDPRHLAGAIDSDGADKAARFMQLCDAFGLPLLFLCDTPGIMVGPDAERTGTVRHAARMFVTGASLQVPFFTIVLRKGYGLGAQAMAGGSFQEGLFTVAWPTGEFGAMGLEGSVRLGFRKELEAISDPAERQATFDRMVAQAYEHGKGLNVASHFELDDVIDPADSRRWILSGLRLAAQRAAGAPRRRTIDTW